MGLDALFQATCRPLQSRLSKCVPGFCCNVDHQIQPCCQINSPIHDFLFVRTTRCLELPPEVFFDHLSRGMFFEAVYQAEYVPVRSSHHVSSSFGQRCSTLPFIICEKRVPIGTLVIYRQICWRPEALYNCSPSAGVDWSHIQGLLEHCHVGLDYHHVRSFGNSRRRMSSDRPVWLQSCSLSTWDSRYIKCTSEYGSAFMPGNAAQPSHGIIRQRRQK